MSVSHERISVSSSADAGKIIRERENLFQQNAVNFIRQQRFRCKSTLSTSTEDELLLNDGEVHAHQLRVTQILRYRLFTRIVRRFQKQRAARAETESRPGRTSEIHEYDVMLKDMYLDWSHVSKETRTKRRAKLRKQNG